MRKTALHAINNAIPKVFDLMHAGENSRLSGGPLINKGVFCITLIFLTGLAIYLRLIGLATRSFWTDESYSYWFAQLSWHDLWVVTPSYETHPPFYYSILKLWCQVFGVSEAAMRSLSVLSSVLTIVVIAAWPRWIERSRALEWIGLGTAALLTVNSGSIEFAQQARPYALETLVVAIMMLTSASLLRDLLTSKDQTSIARKSIGKTVALGVSGGLTLWLHNTSAFIILGNWMGLGIALLAVSKRKRRDFSVFGASLLIALLIWSPCVPILLEETRTVASNFWPTISSNMFSWPLTLAAGGAYSLLPVCIMTVVGAYRLYRKQAAFSVYCIVTLFLPMVLIFTLSYLFRPVFVSRTFLWMGPVIAFLVCYAIVNDPARTLSKVAAFVGVMALAGYQTLMFYQAPSQNYRGLFDALQTRAAPQDIILVYPNVLGLGLTYYQRLAPQRLDYTSLPSPFPAVGIDRPYLGSNKGEPEVIDADRPNIDSLIAGRRKVWLVSWAEGLREAPDVVQDELKKKRGLPISKTDFNGMTISEFDSAPVP